MRTVYFGNNPELLLSLINNSHVLCIFCRNSDNESILKIKNIAHSNNIPIFTPSKKELFSYISYLCDLNADLFFVCGYKYIIPRDIFELPSRGTVNLHPSLLPKYRGQHVINWAIINGEIETGITFHLIDEGIDTGDILYQKVISISSKDTAYSLHNKIYHEASLLLPCVLNDISSAHYSKPLKQRNEDATSFPPRKPEDGQINWNKCGKDVCNLIRGLVRPWPGAYSFINNTKIILWTCTFESKVSNGVNGQILDLQDDMIVIKVKDGLIICDDYSLCSEGENTDSLIRVGNVLK